jgi:hypothetical protein
MLLETLSTVASFHRLQSIMIDTCYGYVPFSLDWDETECAPLDSALSALSATVEFEVILGSETHEDANELFPKLTSRNMVRGQERCLFLAWFFLAYATYLAPLRRTPTSRRLCRLVEGMRSHLGPV